MNTTNTKTRGRPTGAVSFINMTVEELASKFSPNTVVPVGRVWLAKQNGAVPTVVADAPAETPAVDKPVVEMTLSE